MQSESFVQEAPMVHWLFRHTRPAEHSESLLHPMTQVPMEQ
jgi:hypothetical protein